MRPACLRCYAPWPSRIRSATHQMNLFGKINPDHSGRASHLESTFSFLSRSNRPAAASVRSALEDWFSHYPDDHKRELAVRFQSDFNSAFHELWLHELLKKCNYRIEVHPESTHHRTSRIDFKAIDPESGKLYLEAAGVTDESDEERAYDRLLGLFLDHINKMHIPDYFIRFVEIRNPNRLQPSAKRLENFISKCIDSIEYEDVLRLSELGAIDDLPVWQYKQDDLEIEFGVIPVSRANRSRLDHQVVGVYPGSFRWGNATIALRRKIAKKATKYGRLDAPFIVAVNCLSKWGTEQIDEIQALYGTEEFLVDVHRHAIQPRRKPDGVWRGLKGPKNRTVSGVLFTQIGPWNLPLARVCLYLNPWAFHPYDGPLARLPRAVPANGELKCLPGSSVAEIFNLPEGWPGKLFE